MYINVLLEEARQCLENYLDRRENQLPPTHFLINCLDLIFKYNFLNLEKIIYHQIKGVSMGSTVAPSIVNIYVSDWENTYIFYPNVNPFWEQNLLFRRFIDDCFVLLISNDIVEKFKIWINILHESIQFTFNYDLNSINFLDVSLRPRKAN